ncbi:hypothetical protein [Sulfurirhabdus autotrophica]|uniref:Uncharacterized protein n=2 Tax=Sulfurirhabdus autotrophica TaxID=1706046 RepID=A0A4R3XSJ6_9PROT|nr:hypothetical protein [Sulfurirhabdus autotrophica]TCV81216.1 hypothetical protein EDC63_1253 [Sulfurirhabdus autotrophica]
MKEDQLAEKLNDLIPKSLDNIIRQNREMAELRLATDAEISAIEKNIQGQDMVKDAINDWRLISLCVKTLNLSQVLLLGKSEQEKCPWITSQVISVDFGRGLVYTKSGSLYKLLNRGEGEPPSEDLIRICAALHLWGSGPLLGVPHFFD